MQNCTGDIILSHIPSFNQFIITLSALERSDRYLRYLIFHPLTYVVTGYGQVTKLT